MSKVINLKELEASLKEAKEMPGFMCKFITLPEPDLTTLTQELRRCFEALEDISKIIGVQSTNAQVNTLLVLYYRTKGALTELKKKVES